MKGIELPINVLIIVAIAIIVLIAVVAMFYTPVNSGGNVVSLDVAKSQACRSLVLGYNCKDSLGTTPASAATLTSIRVDNFDADGKDGANSPNDNLKYLCIVKYGIGTIATFTDTDASNCRKVCGCAE
jgi:hypothetical protein